MEYWRINITRSSLVETARSELMEAWEAIVEGCYWKALDLGDVACKAAIDLLFVSQGRPLPVMLDEHGRGPSLSSVLPVVVPDGWHHGDVDDFQRLRHSAAIHGGCWGDFFPDHRERIADLLRVAGYVLWLAEVMDPKAPPRKVGSVAMGHLGRTLSRGPGLAMIGDPLVREHDGRVVATDTPRTQCFQEHGTRCTVCGLEGRFFAIEEVESPNYTGWALNLYGMDETGAVYFTGSRSACLEQDASEPRASAGPLCWPCSSRGGDKQQNRGHARATH